MNYESPRAERGCQAGKYPSVFLFFKVCQLEEGQAGAWRWDGGWGAANFQRVLHPEAAQSVAEPVIR